MNIVMKKRGNTVRAEHVPFVVGNFVTIREQKLYENMDVEKYLSAERANMEDGGVIKAFRSNYKEALLTDGRWVHTKDLILDMKWSGFTKEDLKKLISGKIELTVANVKQALKNNYYVKQVSYERRPYLRKILPYLESK